MLIREDALVKTTQGRATTRLGIDTLIANILVVFDFHVINSII